jgi:hypothetical protein
VDVGVSDELLRPDVRDHPLRVGAGEDVSGAVRDVDEVPASDRVRGIAAVEQSGVHLGRHGSGARLPAGELGSAEGQRGRDRGAKELVHAGPPGFEVDHQLVGRRRGEVHREAGIRPVAAVRPRHRRPHPVVGLEPRDGRRAPALAALAGPVDACFARRRGCAVAAAGDEGKEREGRCEGKVAKVGKIHGDGAPQGRLGSLRRVDQSQSGIRASLVVAWRSLRWTTSPVDTGTVRAKKSS